MTRRSPARDQAAQDAPAASPASDPAAEVEQAVTEETERPPAAASPASDPEPPITDAQLAAEAGPPRPKPVPALPLVLREIQGADLLAELCYVFGINPDPKRKPKELAGYRYYPGEPDGTPPVTASMVVVLAGGLKICYPMDEATEDRLRSVFGAYETDPKTKEVHALPLPQDLTLPRTSVDGIVRTQEHQYRTGYLHEGGRDEADRRERLRALRQSGRIR